MPNPILLVQKNTPQMYWELKQWVKLERKHGKIFIVHSKDLGSNLGTDRNSFLLFKWRGTILKMYFSNVLIQHTMCIKDRSITFKN
jgi:hypothetical protein